MHPRRQCFCDSWPWPLTFWHQHDKWFPGLIVEHFCITFGDASCIDFWDIVQKNRQTHTQRGENPTLSLSSAWVINSSQVHVVPVHPNSIKYTHNVWSYHVHKQKDRLNGGKTVHQDCLQGLAYCPDSFFWATRFLFLVLKKIIFRFYVVR